MKYKLIKAYPGSPKKGTIVEKTNGLACQFVDGKYLYGIGRDTEFWAVITEDTNESIVTKHGESYDEWRSNFICHICEYEDPSKPEEATTFTYLKTIANGDCYECPMCSAEVNVGPEPDVEWY